MITFDFEGVEMSEDDVVQTLDLLDAKGLPTGQLRAFIQEMKSRLKKAENKTGFQMGVGNGTGNLFVYGDHESIKVAQSKFLELEALRLIRERMSICRLGSLGTTPEESMNFSRMMDAVRSYDAQYRKK